MKHAMTDKITLTHTSVTDTAHRVVMAADRLPSVSMISLGPIIGGLHGNGSRLDFKVESDCLTVIVYGARSKQTFRAYTSAPEEVKAALLADFYSKRKGYSPEPG